ncbi:MAG: hypothetical protein FD175_1583 [Beijerinckiaceae bacterium]|nr:MAG: hypothetical protein FD175_1583 [Beijerinckiaceae bacterium]
MQNLLGKLGLGEQATSMVVWVGLSILLLVIVVALAVWLVRTLRPALNMSGSAGRGGRPQRLAITDAFTLDREGRKLVIIRRDNVEHLLLIGGPNDVLVESAIVRGERNIRDRTGRNVPEGDALAAEVAMVNDVPRNDGTAVPPQAPIAAPQVTMAAPSPRPVSPPTQAAKPVPPAGARMDDDFERALVAMQTAQRQQATQQRAAVPPAAPVPTPQQPSPPPARPPLAAPAPMPVPPFSPAPAPAAPAAAPQPASPPRTEPVSEMARRLNEVLQKPLSGSLRPPFNKPIPPVPATMNSAPMPPAPATPAPPSAPLAPPPAPDLPPEPNKAREPVPAKPPAQAPVAPAPSTPAKPQGADLEMDLLEEEMARLLGRPGQPKPPGAS